MPPILAAVFTTVALAAGLYAWRQIRTMRRALTRERAAARLTEHTQHRDRLALQAQVRTALAEQAVLAEADQVLDTAIARYVRNTPKGGPTC